VTPRESLAAFFNDHLALPPEACVWLLQLWDVIQVFDDVADKDDIARSDLESAIFASLVDLPANPFFRANQTVLLPVVAAMILKWKASDDAERAQHADEKSFVWRAGYYDVVLQVVLLCHGSKTAMSIARFVMDMYGESFADYVKEFSHA
jgi:hypothetical protein